MMFSLQDKIQSEIRQRRKKKILFFAIASICIVTLLGTYARLSKHLQAQQNEFQIGRAGIEVIESDPVSWDKKQVYLKAADDEKSVPGVARVMFVPRVLNASGEYVQVDFAKIKAPVGNNMVIGDITLKFSEDWEEKWFFKEGYFYYKTVLEPGEETTVLLQQVHLSNDTQELKDKYKDLEIKVDVLADILQAEGNAANSEWGVTVEGNTVTN